MRAAIFVVLCAALGAQDHPDDEVRTSRTPTPEQISERLEKVKSDLLPRIWSPKIAKAPIEQKKYLEKWQAVTSAHYILFTNGPTATCKKYAVTLEELYASVKKEIPFTDLDYLLTCYIFEAPEDYYRFCGFAAGWSEEAARGTAGHATSVYYACYYSAPRDAVVFHEATHQVVGACHKVTGVGSWFHEGVAMYFEKKAIGEKPAGSIKSDIKRGFYHPLTEFIAIPSLIADGSNSHRNYDHAGALIDFMMNTKLPPVAGKFSEFMKTAGRGRGFAEGAEVSAKLIKDVYGLSVAELEALWKEHLGLK